MLVERLRELGEHAVNVKSRILLEPLNRKEAYFLRRWPTPQRYAAMSPAPNQLHGDFWHMTWEETSDMGAILGGRLSPSYAHRQP